MEGGPEHQPFIEGSPLSLFDFQKIEHQDPLFHEVLALRYKVYCEERGFENPEDHPDGLERDEYDSHAVHFAALLKSTRKVVGTVRLILHSESSFPIERAFTFNKDLSHLHPRQLGEVSRLALSKSYCQELQQARLRSDSEAGAVVNGLLRCLAEESLERGISHLYAVMARGLPILMARRKVLFSQIGPEREYHGLRAPYLGAVRDIVNRNPVIFHTCQAETPLEAVA
ncbi:PEP-CTERM/exosortase system-associated acyltransferase [Desulfuromonas acetexigens]|jgi:N-acyl amino acid synthase of PEP-CTERM/exosortase system|uniref:PEP-CTERM/exosortase system-associated acyltransferase n=1 Tax=Trichloromonas acetexigens TaxID=38815 RepID=A0A550JJE1_9BACT|nr:PEP-CTERM/exosortase system-associated acyltransferase [Desulfuromonas acetexigens]